MGAGIALLLLSFQSQFLLPAYDIDGLEGGFFSHPCHQNIDDNVYSSIMLTDLGLVNTLLCLQGWLYYAALVRYRP